MKTFRITWVEGYGDVKPEIVERAYFHEGRGFTQLERLRISRLEVGATWEYREGAEYITVERLS